jgi:hypothetical protein
MKKFIIFIAAVAMVFSFVPTAMADVDLYGSARMWTYWVDKDEEASSTGYDDDDLLWKLGPFSRFGANFKSDKITGKFELDARDTGKSASSVGDMRLRLLYGEYDFGAGKLLVGQNWPLTDWAVSMIQITGGGIQPYGGMGVGIARKPQIRLTVGDLKLAFLTPNTSTKYAGQTDTDTTLPQIEARYTFKLGDSSFDILGAYQTMKYVDALDSDETVNSYIVGARGKFNFGPAYLNLTGKYQVNGGNYGMSDAARTSAMLEDGRLEDNTAWGFAAVLGYKVNDMFTIETTYGYINSEEDVSGDYEDEAQAYGVTAMITVAPGVYLIPEIVVLDGKDVTNAGSSTDQGKVTNFGMVWRIDFK